MKRWALVTVGLYLALTSAVVTSALFFLVGEDRDFILAFHAWFLPALGLVQAALLLIPVRVAEGRPVGRRPALVSAFLGAVPLALLVLLAVFFLLLMLLGEDGVDPFFPAAPTILGVTGIWLFFGALFFRAFSPDSPDSMIRRMTRWLLRGSILEVLVAVPAHILSRQREECCAPGFTLVGIATGLAVAILAFGPGVFYILVRRVEEKRKTSR